MRPLAVYAALAALFVLAPESPAQILKFTLKDPKLYKSFKVGVVNIEGEDWLIGEAKSGLKEEGGKIELPQNTPGHPGVFELWVRNRCLTRSVSNEGAVLDEVQWNVDDILRWFGEVAVL